MWFAQELDMMVKFGLEDGDGYISKAEFIILSATRIGGLNPTIVHEICDRFRELDKDGGGSLAYNEILEEMTPQVCRFFLLLIILSVMNSYDNNIYLLLLFSFPPFYSSLTLINCQLLLQNYYHNSYHNIKKKSNPRNYYSFHYFLLH